MNKYLLSAVLGLGQCTQQSQVPAPWIVHSNGAPARPAAKVNAVESTVRGVQVKWSHQATCLGRSEIRTVV